MGTQDVVDWMIFTTKCAAGLAGVVALLLYQFQDKILYVPDISGMPKTPDKNPPGYVHPGEYTVGGSWSRNSKDKIKYETHFVETSDGEKIHTWLMLQEGSENLPTLIYFHGNAANMGFRLPKSKDMFALAGINILMMDYRGYGSSTGTPSERGLNEDASAVLHYALQHPRLKNSKMVLFGDSLGGAVCVSLAHRHPDKVHALILENTFTSISAMVDRLFPFLAAIKGIVLRIQWDSLLKIKDLTQPILFISGDSDELVPPPFMKALHDAATRSARRDFYSISGGRHNDSFERAGARPFCERIRRFLGHAGPAAAARKASLPDTDAPKLTTAEVLPNVY